MFELPSLSYPPDALSPHMSAETLQFHHGKHHRAYVDALNEEVADSGMEELSLDELIRRNADASDRRKVKIFNNAGQHWNHSFFWQSLSPSGGGMPQGQLAGLIGRDLGGLAGLRDAVSEQGAGHFGSGWIWLILDKGQLQITTTHDADTPIAHGQAALVCCDLWEHAYYLDYRNRRPDFLDAFLSHLVNWRFAETNLSAAA